MDSELRAGYDTLSGSEPDETPTMSTCEGIFFEDQHELSTDDHANMANMHANSSFEVGTDYSWRKQGGASLTLINSSSVASDGNWSATLGGTAQGHAVVNTTRVYDPGNMDVRVNFKKLEPGSSGTITYKLLARQINLSVSTDDCVETSFVNDWDLNDPSLPTLVFASKASNTKTPTSSWQWPDTANWNPPSSWEGADVRVKIINNMTIGSDPADVAIDHARARGL